MDEIGSIIKRLEHQRAAIERAIAALHEITPAAASAADSVIMASSGTRKKRVLSAAGRKSIADAARKRWALIAQERGKTVKKTARKGGLTAAGRKRLSEMMRQRWAAKKAEGTQPIARAATKKKAAK